MTTIMDGGSLVIIAHNEYRFAGGVRVDSTIVNCLQFFGYIEDRDGHMVLTKIGKDKASTL